MNILLTDVQLNCMTVLTRDWDKGPTRREIDGRNRKPFRSYKQKAEAAKRARRTDGGYFRSSVPRQYHDK